MSTKLFLSLGDVIQIKAPNNLAIDNHIFLISYLDDHKIKLIDAQSSDKPVEIELGIKAGQLSDESIKEISILNRADQKGFAKQQQLVPSTWIDIYFGGEVPAVLTGEIISLEEDMIEIELYPDKRKIFIDFAYKGIPPDLPIVKINIRESPMKEPSPSPETEAEASIEGVAPAAAPDLKALIQEGDEIIFGEEEYMIQVVEVPEEERRFGMLQQSEDLLDELLAGIPTNRRTSKVLNNIHLMIERFKQLRNMYSIFDEYGNPEGMLVKGGDYKPLVESLLKLNQKLYWIVPIVKNRKKLYDIIDYDFEDIVNLTLADTREEIYTLMEHFKQNSLPGDENKYDDFMRQLYPYLQPFERTSELDNLLISKSVGQHYNALVNNMEGFESTVFGVEPYRTQSSKQPPVTHNMSFLMDRYILGLSKLIGEDKRGVRNIRRVPLTPNNTMDIQSFLLLPSAVIRYSNINLPNCSILEKAQLHMVRMYYYKLIQAKTPIHLTNVTDNNNFIRAATVVTHKDVGEPGIQKYRSFLDHMVPKTIDIINLFQKYIHHGTSYMNIIGQLEPFMIYANDISYKQYEMIVRYMDNTNSQWKKDFITNRQVMENYRDFIYKEQVYEDPLFSQMAHLYNIPDGFTPPAEILLKMLHIDGARVFTILLTLHDINLHGNIDMDQELQEQLSQAEKILEQKEEQNTCINYILAKKYLEMDELDADNNKEVYFEKRYDITRYGLLDEMKVQRAQMDKDEFRAFLTEHLKMNVGLKDAELMREVDALLTGKRLVVDGDYAMLSLDNTSTIQYFKRESNRWVLDDTIGGENWTDVFCNLQKKCLRVNGDCNDMDVNKALIEKQLLAEILHNFDHDVAKTQAWLQKTLSANLEFYKHRLALLLLLEQRKPLKYEMEKIRIGLTYDQQGLVVSPLARVRDLILAQADFPKKQQDIKKFIARFCRIGGDPPHESPYWYYDAELSVPLIPTFFKSLADAFEEDKYQEVLQIIVRDRGRLSDAGDSIVDKHSGYEIKKIDYVILEEYDEMGFRVVSRDLLEKDEGEAEVAQVMETKKYASQDAQLISNVVKTMERFLSISLASEIGFIIKNVTDKLRTMIKKKAAYDKKKAKAKKRIESYERIKNNALLILTLCYIVVSTQTMIPSPRAKKTFPGCKRSFKGFPFDGVGDMGFLNYIACIIYTIKLEGEPWLGLKVKRKKGVSRDELKARNIKELVKTLAKFLNKHVLGGTEVKERFRAKREFLSIQGKKVDIEEEHSITGWTTFLPPLQLIHIPNIRSVSSAFMDELFTSVKEGKWVQFEQLSLLKGKIILYSLAIQQSIQRVINKVSPLLKNMADEPFIENVCCNVGSQNTMEYFSTQEPSIQTHNAMVVKLSVVEDGVWQLSRAPYLYDPRDTALVYPPISDRFTENTIYRTFIRYCRFNSGIPLPDNLQMICVDNKSEFISTDTFEEKMRILKQEGKHYTMQQFYNLLTVVERRNIVNIDFNANIISSRTRLESLLDYLHERDVNQPLLAFYRETLDYVDIQEDEPQNIMQQMETYLSLAIPELRDTIFAFIRDHSNITGSKLNKIKIILETLGDWYERGEGIYISKDDETHIFSATFFKNNITNLARVYPSIILDKVDYENINIPTHWNFSVRHQSDLREIISTEFKRLRPFYDNPHLIETLQGVRESTKNILRIIDVIPFFARTRDANILFGGKMFNGLMQFYYLSTLNAYIEHKKEAIIVKEREVQKFQKAGLREIELEQGKMELIDEVIAALLAQFLLNYQVHKKTLNVNNAAIREKALKSRETEKNKMTRELGLLAPAEREVVDLMKTHKLGKWSVGLTRALFEYDQEQYDKEQLEIEKDARVELQLEQMGTASTMNRNILKMDLIAEQKMEERAWGEAYNISDLPDDDDFGENDGDEAF